MPGFRGPPADTSQPSYLKLDGRSVVFVYGGVESCSVADRRHEANAGIGAYLVLPAFDGFRTCANEPDSWLFYSAAIPEFELHGYSYGICPGFFRRPSRGSSATSSGGSRRFATWWRRTSRCSSW